MKPFKILAIRALSDINRSASPRVLNPIKHSCSYIKQYINYCKTLFRSMALNFFVNHDITSCFKYIRKKTLIHLSNEILFSLLAFRQKLHLNCYFIFQQKYIQTAYLCRVYLSWFRFFHDVVVRQHFPAQGTSDVQTL